MPFTPFHLGPGALLKGAGGRHFSFMVFGGSQVLIDLEPGYRMIVGDAILHGPSHTVGGALVIAIIATLIGKPISEFVLRLIRYPRPTMTWAASAAGAFLGTGTHILIDAVMHHDMQPWQPFAAGNGLLGALSLPVLHGLCMAAGVFGALFYVWRLRRNAG